jgi:hypothetical protein
VHSLERAYDAVVVRTIWITEHGKLCCVEDRPDVCPNRHQVLQRPGWGNCPGCQTMLRTYTCDECRAVSVDDQHWCRWGRPWW